MRKRRGSGSLICKRTKKQIGKWARAWSPSLPGRMCIKVRILLCCVSWVGWMDACLAVGKHSTGPSLYGPANGSWPACSASVSADLSKPLGLESSPPERSRGRRPHSSSRARRLAIEAWQSPSPKPSHPCLRLSALPISSSPGGCLLRQSETRQTHHDTIELTA